MEIQIDQARLLSELQTLATFTDAEPASDGTAVTRIVFSADDLRARAWLKELALAEGFEVRDDAVGNIFIRWPGAEPDLPAVATGSHTDAIPHAHRLSETPDPGRHPALPYKPTGSRVHHRHCGRRKCRGYV